MGGALPSCYPAAAEVLGAILVLELVGAVSGSAAEKLINFLARSLGPAEGPAGGLAARRRRPST